jgi:hypothetical protein
LLPAGVAVWTNFFSFDWATVVDLAAYEPPLVSQDSDDESNSAAGSD